MAAFRASEELKKSSNSEASPGPRRPGRPPKSETLARSMVEVPTRQKLPSKPKKSKLSPDDEGPDYWKIHIMKLKERGTLDEKIDHSMNIDWVLTHEYLADYFVKLQVQPAFIPRRGEVVLWVPLFSGTLEIKPGTDCWHMRSENGDWLGLPQWRAGVITQAPEEPSNFFDIARITKKNDSSMSSWGYRVETLPDPVGDDKSFSLQYTYLPLSFIKPFGSFTKFLQKSPSSQRHPSLEHAMRTMASWSLLSHVRFSGTWPNAQIDSNGIFIGPDLIAIRDTVRLKPFGLKTASLTTYDPVDVMVVERIWLEMEGCHEDPYDPLLADKVRPMLAGKVYTRDKDRLLRPMPFDKDPLEKLTDKDLLNAFSQSDEGDWYRIAGGRTCAVSQVMVLGRCYEPTANLLLYGNARLDYDLNGVLSGRLYSNQTDERIPIEGDWFWGDNRVETLGLATMNGVEVGEAAEQREHPRKWQAILKVINGTFTNDDLKTAGLKDTSSRGHPLKQFAEVSKTSTLVSSSLGEVPATGSEDSDFNMSESELLASIPFKGVVDEDGQRDYQPK
ncbi:hypothetical protein N7495_005076 [Penicillium taxi]|uniref:uncharacterized protein n=1 Tax=Penicillium taxi TaxID=168475 RepID=UPI0025450B8E|nr:uncharacterized protein N7495_005076 [Penicillium taxi]KAJ5893385.1 hypothetical protein N7495_005076 [Penicillium taxi]